MTGHTITGRILDDLYLSPPRLDTILRAGFLMAKDWTGILMANGKGLDTQVRPGFWWLIALSGQSSVAGQNFLNP